MDPARLLRDSFSSIGLDRMSTRLGIALLIVSAIFFAANFADKAWVSYQVAQEKQARLYEIRQTQEQIGQLTGDLKYMRTRAYYVQAARAFGFVQPGDIPVAIQPASPIAPPVAADRAVAQPSGRPPAHHKESVFRRILQAIVPGL